MGRWMEQLEGGGKGREIQVGGGGESRTGARECVAKLIRKEEM